MVRKLRAAGWRCIDTPNLDESELNWNGEKFDVISIMNVLDRCSKPLSLLKSVKKYLTTENGLGIVLLALVIPYHPYVESGREQLEPEEYMNIKKNTNFEIGVISFIDKVLIPEGWNVINFAR